MPQASTSPFRFGIDLGGTKIELLALDQSGQERFRKRVSTPGGNYEATVECIAGLVNEAESELGGSGTVGIATPGSLSLVSDKIKNANSTCLNGKPLKQDLETALKREVRICNDANCFALSEAIDGAGAGSRIVFGVILGTGVGGGIVIDGKLLTGVNAIAGEWGHNALPDQTDGERTAALRCYCGRINCIETWLSGPALTDHHLRVTEEALSALDIAARADQGDMPCTVSMRRYAERLGRALAGVINVLDPDVIVLGGGLANIGMLYESVPVLWKSHVFSDHVSTRLVPPKYGDSSGVRGAAWLWND
jgi:fructokinase